MGPSHTTDVYSEAALLDQVALLGRKSELRQLIKALTLCRSGQGKGILLTGNEGIGKTSLLTTFLELAQHPYGCRALVIPLPPQATAPFLFVNTVDSILTLSRRIMTEGLRDANRILEPFSLHWTEGDLTRIVALMRLQESMGNRQGFAVEQLTQVIQSAMPFLKRFNTPTQEPVQRLAQLLLDPWMTLAVSLVNPINPQVQHAVSLMQAIRGDVTPSARLLTAEPPVSPLLSECSEMTAPVPVSESQANNLEPPLTDVTPPESPMAPSLANLQRALTDLLGFINNGLRQTQTAFILTVDAWDALMDRPEAVRKEIQDLMAEMLHQSVEQRDSRLMLLLSCRSEAESYALGGPLYNALRTKQLVSPLAPGIQQRFIKERLKAHNITCEEPVLQAMLRLCQGNPAWLTLMMNRIEADLQQSGLKTLSWDVYQERFSINHPTDLLEAQYTRLQLGFVGEESLFLKLLGKLLTAFATQPFPRPQALRLGHGVEGGAALMERLLEALVQHGFLVPEPASSTGESTYRFYSAFLLPFLVAKARPLQEEFPTADKVASLKKVLPLSIQSGELSTEKTQELLAMASALESPDLVPFVEHTLIEALGQDSLPQATKLAVLESLGLLTTPDAVHAIMQTLQSSEPVLREHACAQLLPAVGRLGNPTLKKALIEAILPLVDDDIQAVRYQAYQLLSLASGDATAVLPTLLAGCRSDDAVIRQLAMTGLSRCRLNTPEVRDLYLRFLRDESDPAMVKMALKGLQPFEPSQVVPALVAFLREESQTARWTEVLMHLMTLDLRQALPWITTFIAESQDTDLKLFVLKKLGSKPNPEVERILTQVLQHSPRALPPEVRWMAIRSLGWIGQTPESLRALESQHGPCQHDEILYQALKSAMRQVAERTTVYSEQPKPQSNGLVHLAAAAFTESLADDTDDEDDEPFIDLVLTGSEVE